MTPEQFTYWMQGFAKANNTPPSEQQWQIIKDHLSKIQHVPHSAGDMLPRNPLMPPYIITCKND